MVESGAFTDREFIPVFTRMELYNSEWAYQRHRLCYKCDVSLWFYLYPCGFDTTHCIESYQSFKQTIINTIFIKTT